MGEEGGTQALYGNKAGAEAKPGVRGDAQQPARSLGTVICSDVVCTPSLSSGEAQLGKKKFHPRLIWQKGAVFQNEFGLSSLVSDLRTESTLFPQIPTSVLSALQSIRCPLLLLPLCAVNTTTSLVSQLCGQAEGTDSQAGSKGRQVSTLRFERQRALSAEKLSVQRK